MKKKNQKTIEERIEKYSVETWGGTEVMMKPEELKSLISDIIREVVGKNSTALIDTLNASEGTIKFTEYEEGYEDGYNDAKEEIRQRARELGLKV